MTRNEAQKIVNEFYRQHKSLKQNGHSIKVIDTIDGFTNNLRENIKGFHRASEKYNDTHVIASEHNSKDELLKTIKHEIYGHYGLNTLSQENKIDILLSVVHLQNTELKDEWNQVRYDYPDKREFQHAEEVFCRVVSKITTQTEFQHNFTATPESIKEIYKLSKYIKMTLQTGDAKQVIIPKNNNLQFEKYTTSMKKYTNKLEIMEQKIINLKSFKEKLGHKRERSTSFKRGLER